MVIYTDTATVLLDDIIINNFNDYDTTNYTQEDDFNETDYID